MTWRIGISLALGWGSGMCMLAFTQNLFVIGFVGFAVSLTAMQVFK